MNAPARKVDQYLRDLGDRIQPMSEFTLRSIIADCKRTLTQVSSYEAVPLYEAMATAAKRLGQYADGHKYAQCAFNLDAQNPVLKANLAVALADIGKYDDALDMFASLTGTDVPEYLLLANISECLARIGLIDDALDAFQDALRVANMSDAQQLMVLAEQAALIGADDAALELIARVVACSTNTVLADKSPLEVITSAPESLREAVNEKIPLRMVIQRAFAFGGIAPVDLSDARADCQLSDPARALAAQEAMAVFEATKTMRARANQAALSEADCARS